MKNFSASLLLFLLFQFHNAQTSLEEINLDYGPNTVGFKHYTLIDSSRTYQIKNEYNRQFQYRPIPVSLWYPAKMSQQSESMAILDYLQILKEEEEWKHLPDYFLLDWFPYLWNTAENRKHLPEMTKAIQNAEALSGEYPVIVYAPSFQASSIENFALCELLASHGFVVISSPSRGTINRWFEGGSIKDLTTQSADVEFLMAEVNRLSFANKEQIALMGFSFGGATNAITAMKNQRVKALISLDGSDRYNYDLLARSPYFSPEALNIPYVHYAQKEIPAEVMKADKIPASLNTDFKLYDSIPFSTAYRYRFHHLTHAYFSTYGVLFGNRDKRQDKSDAIIMSSYKLLTGQVLLFLKAHLQDDAEALALLSESNMPTGSSEGVISKQIKVKEVPPFTYLDFIDQAFKNDYKDLLSLYNSAKKEHPKLEVPENILNTLGLRKSFDPVQFEQGIAILRFALELYPSSANLYDSLAEAYLFNNKRIEARKAFKKSLQLNSENQNAIKRLKELR